MTVPAASLTAALGDRYAIERELGRGGMATVYLAADLKHERQVAIKVLHPGLAASLGPDRFLREIRIAARLAHPHILPLIDSGEAVGMLYYVTPHVAEGSLRDLLDREGRLSLALALRVLRDVGGALDYAHRQGFVHRDVKPDNILFADGHAVLADFGIARVVSAAGSMAGSTEPLTDAGLAIGTPEYMSPEQAAGESDLGGASDVYSLACVAYEMLGGEPPLKGAGARATIAKQIAEVPRPVRVLRPDVPAALERVLTRALAKNPADRFPTAAALVASLDTPESGPAPASWTTRSIAVLPFVNASIEPDNEYLSDGITDELINALAKVEGLRVASRTSVFALKGKPADVRAIGALLGASWVLEGTVRRAGARLRITAQLTSADDGQLLWSERFDRTLEDVFAIQEEIARTIVDTLRVTSFAELAMPAARRGTSSVSAYGLYLKGRYAWNKRSQEGIAEAIGYFEQAMAADPSYAQAHSGLADAYSLSLDYRNVPVADSFARAEQYARRAIALDDGVAEAHASLAWALFIHDWDWDLAGHEFRRAIELDPGYATARQWYSFWLAAMNRISEGLAEIHRAQELDPASVSIRRSLGWVYYYARRSDQARYHMERAIAMNPLSDESYRILGLVNVLDGRWDDAERALREAILLAPASTYNAATLGYILARAERRAEAQQALADISRIAEREYVSPVALATLHLGLGNQDEALTWMERAQAERRGWLAYLRVLPIVDPVRDHPRFAALLRAMHL